MEVAIVDLDGVVANSEVRFALATDVAGKINWKVALDPALVPRDTLIPGVAVALAKLESLGYTVYFLTSRPERMRDATEQWLALYGLHQYHLIMKPANAQFVKTVRWKADVVAQVAELHQVVYFIDDEPANRAAIEALELGIVCKDSLQDWMVE